MHDSFLAGHTPRRILRRVSARSFSTPHSAAVLLVILTLIGWMLGTRFADPRVRLDVGGPRDEQMLVRFHAVEYNERDYYRWSQPVAALFFYGYAGQPAIVSMRLTSPRPPAAPPPTLVLRVGERPLGTFALATEHNWRQYHLLVPTRATGETALVLRSPAFQPGYPDTRELGVALNRVAVRPAGSSDPALVSQRAVFLLTLPLVTWLALWRAGVRQPFAFGCGAALAALVGWAAAFPVQSGYLLPTVGWPWWPLLPLLGLLYAPGLRHRWTALLAWLRRHVPFTPWSGALLTFVAVIALRLGVNVPVGLTLMLIGTLLTTTSLTHARGQAHASLAAQPVAVRSEVAGLVLLTLLAVVLRLYQLDTLPPGLWRDEARHGALAWRIWHDPTFRPVYVVEGADLPALLFYLMAPVVGVFGPQVWSARLVSALAGALTPLALWWAARPLIGARGALISAALIAWASWSLSMSRWAFPATLDHLLVLTALGLMWRALPIRMPTDHVVRSDGDLVAETSRHRRFASASLPHYSHPATAIAKRQAPSASIVLLSLAALCAGLAAYTYHTGRLAPITLAVLTALRLGARRDTWRWATPALAAALLVGLLTLAPLLRFIAADLEGYNRRVASVSVFDSNSLDVHAPLSLLLRNFERYLLMWHVSGEPNGRHHAPGAPMLDPVGGTLLLVGAGVVLARWQQREVRAIVLLLGFGLLPGLLSGNAPHALRALGALAPACMLAALGLEALARAGGQLRHARFAGTVLLVSTLSAGLVWNTWLYFGKMPFDPAVYNEFDVTETAMARVARVPFTTSDPDLRSVRVFLPADIRRSETVRFLTRDIAVGTFDGRFLSDLPGRQALLLLPGDASPETCDRARAALGPAATPIGPVPYAPRGERPLFLAYGIGDQAERLLRAAVTEMGYAVQRSDETREVTP